MTGLTIALLLLPVTGLAALVAVGTWRRRWVTGARPLAGLMLAVALWTAAYALEMMAGDLPTKLFWSKASYLGIVVVPGGWLAFAMHYSGLATWLTRRRLALLALIPVITLALAWTNEAHGLIWTRVWLGDDPLRLLGLAHGSWFWVHVAYSYLVLAIGTAFMVGALVRSRRLTTTRLGLLLLGLATPWVASVVYLSGRGPAPGLDLTPAACALTGLAFWSLLRFRLADLVLGLGQVARDAIVEGMPDGFVVVDGQGYVIDLNPAARQLVGQAAGEMIGRPAAEVLWDWPLPSQVGGTTGTRPVEFVVRGHAEHGAPRTFSLVSSPLFSWPEHTVGHLIVVRDVSERVRAEAAHRASEDRNRAILGALPDLILRVSREGVVLDFHANDDQRLDFPRDSITGLPIDALLPAVVAEASMTALRRALATGQTQVYDYELGAEGAAARRYEGRMVVSGGDEVLVIIRDMTDLRQAAELKERQAHQLALRADVSLACGTSRSLDHLLQQCADTLARHCGAELVGIWMLVPGADELEPRARSGGPPATEGRQRRLRLGQSVVGRVGRSRQPILTSQSPATDADDDDPWAAQPGLTSRAGYPLVVDERLLGVIGLYGRQPWPTDILDSLAVVAEVLVQGIERRRAEEAAREGEERLRLVVQATNDVVWDWDLRADTIWWNEGLQAQFGFGPTRVPPEAAWRAEQIHPEDRDQVMTSLRAVIDSRGQGWSAEYRFRRADGTYAVVLDRGSVMCDGAGAPTRMIGAMMDVSTRKALEDRLSHQAFHDPLTELANRALFRDLVTRALARTARQMRPLAVLVLDLDGFKTINDSFGHAAGDRLLVAIAARLRERLRTGDTAARLGGDEFAILLEDLADQQDAIDVAQRVGAILRAPIPVEGREVVLGASIGIAVSFAGVETTDELIRNADIAMYHAKRHRHGGFACFTPPMHAAVLDRLEVEEDLRWAVERQELRLVYQPVIALGTGRIVGVEALVRWQHPRRGLLSPALFIPVAEETGQILAISRWVLREACRQAQLWRSTAPMAGPLTVSVNVSPSHVHHPDFVDDVRQALTETRLDPRALVIEITEGTMMQQIDITMPKLLALKDLGTHLALDDFGTGYSSLSYLQRFPISILKIDRTFVSGIGHDPEATAIVRAIVNLARTLNLRVTGEGIETAAQVKHLRSLGCELGQGFFFAQPLPPEAIAIRRAAPPITLPELESIR